MALAEATPPSTAGTAEERHFVKQRDREVRRLFTRIGLHIVWHDVVLNRGPLKRFRTDPVPRWAGLARHFRAEAERLGGVLIKLGQYVGARTDLLPPEVTNVFDDLHDSVPPAPAERIVAQIEEDFGLPLATLFPQFEPVAIGAASLGQAHRARMSDGTPVVVKVLRPGIRAIVEADLAVVRIAIRRLRGFRAIRRRVDLELLTSEFSTVTRRELDCREEGRSAERFAADFAGVEGIVAPRIYWSHSAARTLTMQDVSGLRVDDVAGLRRAGIDPLAVARRLTDCYLDQIFRNGFVHADPHPGNLFVRPHRETERRRPGRALDRGFDIAFVDFGMTVSIPPHARTSLRTYALGVATGDAYTIVQSYVEGDLLLPEADVEEIERMTAQLIARMPRAFAGQVRASDMQEYARIFADYQGLLYATPMKLKADLLFVFRAMGICSGTVARIAPHFDPAECFGPLAQRMLADELAPDGGALKRFGAFALRLPGRLDALLTQIERGKLRLRVDDGDIRRRDAETLARAARRIVAAIVGAGAIAAIGLYGAGGRISLTETVGAAVAVAAVTLFVALRR